MSRRTILLAIAGAGVISAAQAQPVSGPYVSLGGGGNILQDEKLQVDGTGLNGSKLNFDDGPAASGAVGYGFGNGFRLQIDGDWRRNRLHGVSNFGTGVSAGGYQEAYGAMADVIFDFDIRQDWIFPYFGAGAGYSWQHWDRVRASGNTGGGTDAIASDGTDGHFAYQGLFGVSLPLGVVPGLSFTAEYRFTGVPSKTSFGASGHIGPAAFAGSAGGTASYNHTGLLGLRYVLFQPAPPPSPSPAAPPQQAAPEVQPSRTYLVFFDWDRADLTARARQIVAEAAQASTHVQTTRIEVNGYTDLSGTAAYNQRLSVRRAESVEAELVRDGVNRGEISIHGFGESNPLVPTAAGVREPQNRRVEIILR